MAGAILLIIAMILIPVGVFATGAAASAILGETLRRDGMRRHEGSELLELPD
jgi:dipeptide/tripeptide permease